MEDLLKIGVETVQKNKQALIFLPSRASAEKTAEDIAKLMAFDMPELEKQILQVVSTPTKQCRRLSHCLRKGIAFHHSGLTSAQKELIEERFKRGDIKIICCTPTLAAGVNLPAYRVIIKSLKRYGEWGMDWIPVLEYLQMTGRAGRPEYETEGEAISIAKDESEQEEIYEKYICGVPEEIYSKLAVEPVLRTYLLSLIAAGIVRDEKSMLDFFSKTFWAFQFEDMNKLRQIMEKMLALLEKWKFIQIEKNDFIAANALKETKIRPTMLGKRISELYLDPLTARHLLNCLDAEKLTVFGALQMISHTLEMRPLLTVRVKDQERLQEEVMKRLESLLQPEPSIFDSEYEDFLRSVKTALFLEGWISEYDEEFLLEQFDIRPGEIRMKIEVADWLLYAVEELLKIQEKREMLKEVSKIRLRVQHGVKEEVLPLLRLRGIGRIRARRLFSNGLRDIGDLKKIELATLTQILGKAIAEDVKKQVGEAVPEALPSGKRKGQLSLGKFE